MPGYCAPCPVNRNAIARRVGPGQHVPRLTPGRAPHRAARRRQRAARLVGRAGDARPARYGGLRAAGVGGEGDVGQRQASARPPGERAAAPGQLGERRLARGRQRGTSAAALDRGGPARRGGASSRTTCALVPLKPNELTPAHAARRPPRGHGVALRSAPRRAARPTRCAGWASAKCRCGGMRLVLERQHHLDQPGDARPRPRGGRCWSSPSRRAAAVAAAGPAPARPPERCDLDRIAERRAGAVRLDVADVRRARRRRCASASRITASCAGPFGTVSPLLRPSWLTAEPRIDAPGSRSPSAQRVATGA